MKQTARGNRPELPSWAEVIDAYREGRDEITGRAALMPEPELSDFSGPTAQEDYDQARVMKSNMMGFDRETRDLIETERKKRDRMRLYLERHGEEL